MEWNTKEQAIFDEFTNNSEKFAFAFLTGRGEEMFSDEVKADEEIEREDHRAEHLQRRHHGHFVQQKVIGKDERQRPQNAVRIQRVHHRHEDFLILALAVQKRRHRPVARHEQHHGERGNEHEVQGGHLVQVVVIDEESHVHVFQYVQKAAEQEHEQTEREAAPVLGLHFVKRLEGVSKYAHGECHAGSEADRTYLR